MTATRQVHTFEATGDMVEGYRDGYDPDAPLPSANRSAAYRHGFANGRDDRAGKARSSATALRALAEAALAQDEDAYR